MHVRVHVLEGGFREAVRFVSFKFARWTRMEGLRQQGRSWAGRAAVAIQTRGGWASLPQRVANQGAGDSLLPGMDRNTAGPLCAPRPPIGAGRCARAVALSLRFVKATFRVSARVPSLTLNS